MPAPPILNGGINLLIGVSIFENKRSKLIFSAPNGWVEGTSIQLKITHANKE